MATQIGDITAAGRHDGQLHWRLRYARTAAYGGFVALTVLAVACGHPQLLGSLAVTYLVAAPMLWHAVLLGQFDRAACGRRQRRHTDRLDPPDGRFITLLELATTAAVLAATVPTVLVVCGCAGLLLVRIATEGGRQLATSMAVVGGLIALNGWLEGPWQSVAGSAPWLWGAAAVWCALLAVAVAWLGFAAQRALSRAHRRERLGHRAFARLAFRLGRYLAPELRHTLQDEAGIAERELAIEQLFEATLQRRLPTRRWLSVCFVDIVGFTALTERAEPEEIAATLDVYQREMAAVAATHGGTVDKFMGDGVLVLFGDHGDGARETITAACLRMTLAMRRCLPQLNARLAALGVRAPLQLRWGVASGMCTIGDFGSDDRLHYTALGRAVNLASRLEGLAEADTIRICARTAALAGDGFALRERGGVRVPGLAEPVVASELLYERESITLRALTNGQAAR